MKVTLRHTHTHTHTYEGTHACIQSVSHQNTVITFIEKYSAHTHTYTHTHIHTHTHTHTYIHTHTQSWLVNIQNTNPLKTPLFFLSPFSPPLTLLLPNSLPPPHPSPHNHNAATSCVWIYLYLVSNSHYHWYGYIRTKDKWVKKAFVWGEGGGESLAKRCTIVGPKDASKATNNWTCMAVVQQAKKKKSTGQRKQFTRKSVQNGAGLGRGKTNLGERSMAGEADWGLRFIFTLSFALCNRSKLKSMLPSHGSHHKLCVNTLQQINKKNDCHHMVLIKSYV